MHFSSSFCTQSFLSERKRCLSLDKLWEERLHVQTYMHTSYNDTVDSQPNKKKMFAENTTSWRSAPSIMNHTSTPFIATSGCNFDAQKKWLFYYTSLSRQRKSMSTMLLDLIWRFLLSSNPLSCNIAMDAKCKKGHLIFRIMHIRFFLISFFGWWWAAIKKKKNLEAPSQTFF